MENKDKNFYLMVNGKKVEVSEEVYRAYVQPIRREQRKKRREWRCPKLSETGGYFVRCKDKCEECPYYLAGNSPLGNVTSLDKLVDCEIEIEDINSDLETKYIEKETQKEEYANLHEAIATLTPRQQEMVRLIYFAGKTEEDVAQIFGIDFTSVSHALKRIKDSLRKKLLNL